MIKKRTWMRWLPLLAGMAWLTGCQRLPELPPLGESGDTRPGAFVWRDLVTPNPAAATVFYQGLFGWTFEPVGDTGYQLVRLDGRPIGGMLDAARTDRPVRSALWLNAISVSDAAATARAVREAGGEVVYRPTRLPGRGRVAVVADPDRALFQVVASESGDPEPGDPAVNDWLWTELLADDPAAATAFYVAVFGHEVVDSDAGGPDYRILRAGGVPVAGVLDNPFEDTRSAWVPFVRVDDLAAALERCDALGGRVVVEPDVELRRSRLALVLDPSGAPLALQEWTPEGEGTR